MRRVIYGDKFNYVEDYIFGAEDNDNKRFVVTKIDGVYSVSRFVFNGCIEVPGYCMHLVFNLLFKLIEKGYKVYEFEAEEELFNWVMEPWK